MFATYAVDHVRLRRQNHTISIIHEIEIKRYSYVHKKYLPELDLRPVASKKSGEVEETPPFYFDL